MKHIKTFEDHITENEVNENLSPLNEAEVFVSDKRIADEVMLKSDILKNMGPAINKLLKDNGIAYNPITVSAGNRGRYEFDSKPLTGKDLGIMQYGLKEVYIDSFGGGSFPKIQKGTAEDGSDFEFTPYSWFNLHYSYRHGAPWTDSQGSNGCSLYLPNEKRSDIFYDIVNAKFITASEAEKLRIWD